MNADKELFITYKGKEIRLTQANKPKKKILSPNTIAKKYGEGGTHFVRDVLGIEARPAAVHLR